MRSLPEAVRQGMRGAGVSISFNGRRKVLGLVWVCFQMTACSEAFGPWSGPAASVDIVAGAEQHLQEVGTRIPDAFTVRVLDVDGRNVAGVTVAWTASAGALTNATSITGRDGLASVQWTLGTVSGTQTLTASVNSLPAATFVAHALPGQVSQILLSRDTVRLLGVGDAFRLTARPADQFGNAVSGSVQIEPADTTVVTATIFGGGAVLTAQRQNATTQVRVSAANLVRTATVIVLPLPCQAPTGVLDLAVGQVAILSGAAAAEFCVRGGAGGAEFTAIPFYSDLSAAAIRLSIFSGGTTNIVAPTAATAIRNLVGAQRMTTPQPDPNFESRLRQVSERDLTPMMAAARAAQRKNHRLNLMAMPQVGDVIQLNTNSSATCSNATMKPARVAAITQRAIVVADMANPPDGFTDTDYQYFGTAFDTLVYSVDTQNFGDPSDIDGNQRVVLFFTRAVNELTPPNQNFFVGGFFSSRDLFPTTGTPTLEGCAASNVAEMFYLLVPDPAGAINQNVRTADFVRGLTIGVLAHEFQHLINASRRLYISNSRTFEDVFLDEGLSHIAEELVFYRSSGLTPGQNISYETTQSSPSLLAAFNQFGAANMRRFHEYLLNPTTNSPYADNATIATRGATWSFLRYAADRKGGSESALWLQLANPPVGVHGMNNLSRVFGADLQLWIRDWATANYADDLVPDIESQDTDPSWNFRSVISGMNENQFGLPTVKLDPANVTGISIRDGSAGYLRFGVPAGGVGGGRVASRAGDMPASVSLSIIRTK
jgi:Big-like domain-containing protein